MKGRLAAYIVSMILVAAVLSGYAGLSLFPTRTVTLTATSTSIETSTNLQMQILTNTQIETATVIQTATVSYAVPGVLPPVTTTVTSTGTPVTTTVTSYYCGAGVGLMTINNSTYCIDDVSGYSVVLNPGYSYFRNGSVNFMGVRFSMICPPRYSGCPGSSAATSTTLTTVSLGIIQFNMTFSDGSVEVAGAPTGDATRVLMLSNHVYPRAGILYQYGPGLPTILLLVDYGH